MRKQTLGLCRGMVPRAPIVLDVTHVNALLTCGEIAEGLAVETVDGVAEETRNHILELSKEGLQWAEGIPRLIVASSSVGEAKDHVTSAATMKMDLSIVSDRCE